MVRTRKAYRKKDNTFVRGTVVKPKFFKKKLVVDLDFRTKAKQTKSGKLVGRKSPTSKPKYFGLSDRTPVIRSLDGRLAGRAKQMKSPAPKNYLIRSGKRTRRIPVLKLKHFD